MSPAKQWADAGSWKSDLCSILRLGWPNSLNQSLSFLPGLGMLFFLGANPEHAAAAGMGFMFSNVAGYSLIVGSGAGAQPLISQAFGAGNFLRCGELLQRQFAIHTVLCVVVAVVWINTEHILLFFKQPAGIARLSAQFVRWRVPGLPFLAIRDDLTNYLVAQRVMQFPMLASVSAGLLNMVAFAILIPRMGFVGAPLAYTIANVAQAAVLALFTYCALPEKAAWPRWSMRTALTGWGEMLALALPGGILMLCEWWGWETNLFFAGLLCNTSGPESEQGCVQLDTFPILANTMVIGFMPSYGFNIAAGALIGNALGANDPWTARRVSRCTLCVASVVSGSIAVTLVAVRRSWGMLFSEDPEIVDLTARAMPVIAAYVFLDSLGPGALVSIYRSMNVVKLPAAINFAAFYIFGIPVGLYLTFGLPDGWGIIGLWFGLDVGMFLMVSSLLLYLCACVDWHEIAEDAFVKAGGMAKSSSDANALSLEESIDSGAVSPEARTKKKSESSPARGLPKAARLKRTIIGKKASYKLVVDSKGGTDRTLTSSAEIVSGTVFGA